MCPIGEIRKFVEADKREPKPSWLTDDEVAMHKKILVDMGGHDAPLNWYKQAMRGLSAAEEEGMPDEQRMIKKPLLYVRTEKDYICLPQRNEEATRKFATNMQVASVDSSHWLMLEKPKETNEAFERFIGGLKL